MIFLFFRLVWSHHFSYIAFRKVRIRLSKALILWRLFLKSNLRCGQLWSVFFIFFDINRSSFHHALTNSFFLKLGKPAPYWLLLLFFSLLLPKPRIDILWLFIDFWWLGRDYKLDFNWFFYSLLIRLFVIFWRLFNLGRFRVVFDFLHLFHRLWRLILYFFAFFFFFIHRIISQLLSPNSWSFVDKPTLGLLTFVFWFQPDTTHQINFINPTNYSWIKYLTKLDFLQHHHKNWIP